MSGFGNKRGAVDETRSPEDIVKRRGGGTSAIIVRAVVLVISLGFLGVAIGLGLSNKAKAAKCTEKASAVVIENREIRSSSNDKKHSGVTYQPIFEYEYGGRKYITGSDSSSDPAAFSVGEEVEIYVNPDDPTKIYVPSDKTSKVIVYLFGGIGGTASLFALILLIKAIKTRNEPDEEVVEMKYYE